MLSHTDADYVRALGISISELARRMGFSREHVSRVLHKHHTGSRKFWRLFELAVKEILTERLLDRRYDARTKVGSKG